jgi:GAF domain-containing protein
MSLIPASYDPKRTDTPLEADSSGTHQVLMELAFQRMIAIERKRTERSKDAFLLILFEAGRHQGSGKERKFSTAWRQLFLRPSGTLT